jgi:hypothetical protein
MGCLEVSGVPVLIGRMVPKGELANEMHNFTIFFFFKKIRG